MLLNTNNFCFLRSLTVCFLIIMLFSGCDSSDCNGAGESGSGGGSSVSGCSQVTAPSPSAASGTSDEQAETDTNALLTELEEMAFFPTGTDTDVTESTVVTEESISTVNGAGEVVSVDNVEAETVVTDNIPGNAISTPVVVSSADDSALSFAGLEFSGSGDIEPLPEEPAKEPVYDDYIKFPEQYGIISDSEYTDEQAISRNLHPDCPQSIVKDQRVLRVIYHSFDGKVHSGQIVIHHKLLSDVEGFFRLAFEIGFPIESVIPISDPRFDWDDDKSMAANNTSGFNYRKVINTDRLSKHATGQAFDVNTRLNPWFHKPGAVLPAGAVYDPSKPGTFTASHKLIKFLKQRGWFWGGDWLNRDNHHLQKDI